MGWKQVKKREVSDVGLESDRKDGIRVGVESNEVGWNGEFSRLFEV